MLLVVKIEKKGIEYFHRLLKEHNGNQSRIATLVPRSALLISFLYSIPNTHQLHACGPGTRMLLT